MTAILNYTYGYGNYHEVTSTKNYEFVPGQYVTTIIQAHQAGFTDPVGWYPVGQSTDTSKIMFDTPATGETYNLITNGNNFGVFIKAGDNKNIIYYSNNSLNPTGIQRAKLYSIDTKANEPTKWVLCFEDLTDQDYQDVVVEVRGASLTSVPEFPTVALPVAAILGLVMIFGRRKNTV